MRRLLLTLCLAATASAQESPAWRSDWNDAFKAAKEEHKMVFVDYFATWCAPCREMDETVFRDLGVQQRMSAFVLLRLDVDRSHTAIPHSISSLPTYIVYDSSKRERFRMSGAQPVDLFAQAIEAIRREAPAFVKAADLFDAKQDVEGAFLAGNTFSHLGLTAAARHCYDDARKAAGKRNDKRSSQLAEALAAFTYVREGNASRAIQLLQGLAAKPVDRETEVLIWLTIGNAYRSTKDIKAALEAYQRAQSAADPNSTAYEEAAAIASLRNTS